jgi:hypothetical protein
MDMLRRLFQLGERNYGGPGFLRQGSVNVEKQGMIALNN